MGNVKTQNSRTDRHRVFKLGGKVDHVTRHVWQLFNVKGQRSRSLTYQQQERYNSAVDRRINFKLGGNYHRQGRRVWYAF